ncbi:MAG: glycoside hydrolase family 9 protein [Pseudomonadota bacterium]
MRQILRPAAKWAFALAVLGTTQTVLAELGPELVTNGTFGNIASTGVATPSTAGWTVLNTGPNTADFKSYSKNFGCSQSQCLLEQKAIFQCAEVPTNSWYTRVQQTLPSNLKPNTRYQFRFAAFTDNTVTSPDYLPLSVILNEITFVGSNGEYLGAALSKQIFPKYASLTTMDVGRIIVEPSTIEFVTSDNVAVMNAHANIAFYINNTGKTKSRGCISNVSLKEVKPDLSSVRVAINGNGYAADGPKIATLVLPAGTTSTSNYRWKLMHDNQVALQTYTWSATWPGGGTGGGGQDGYPTHFGTLDNSNAARDPDSGDTTVLLDFSDFSSNTITVVTTGPANGGWTQTKNTKSVVTPNDYWILVTDANGNMLAKSNPFKLNGPKGWPNGSNKRIKTDALNALTSQRSGAAVSSMYTGLDITGYFMNETRTHAASHAPDLATCWVGADSNGMLTTKDLHGNDWGNGGSGCVDPTGAAKKIDVTGGWYDAADHGKYVVNGGIALWTLQNQIERLQNKGSLSQLPGLLAEAKHEMDWMIKMQIKLGDNGIGPRMKVPLGYQDKIQTGPTYGPNGSAGVYQVDLLGQPMAPTAKGAVDFGGGQIPRLRMKLDLTEVDVGGMVFHAVHDQNWTGLPLDPSKDTQPRVLMYPTTAATLNFAAVAAQASRIFRASDPQFAEDCLKASKLAWKSAKKFRTGKDELGNVIGPANSDIFRYEFSNQNWAGVDTSGTTSATKKNNALLQYGFAVNPMFNGGGAYGDLRLGDEFYWAGAELTLATAAAGAIDTVPLTYGTSVGVLTGTDIYAQYSACNQTVQPVQCYGWINGFDWQNVHALGTLSMLTYKGGALADPKAKTNLTAFADALVTQTNGQGYRFPKLVDKRNNLVNESSRDYHYEWGSNGNVLNRAMILAAASEWQSDAAKKKGYVDATVSSMDYLLGRNAMGASFISGYGTKPMANPHHRWYALHADPRAPRTPAGFISGGPNSRDIPALRANAPRYENASAVNYAKLNGDPAATLGGISDMSARFFEENVVKYCMDDTGLTGAVYFMQKCHMDHYRSFASNEVAVNWNAPLIWVTQFLSEIYP